jgi:hypothetical protein
MNRRFFLGILIVVVVGGVAVMFITTNRLQPRDSRPSWNPMPLLPFRSFPFAYCRYSLGAKMHGLSFSNRNGERADSGDQKHLGKWPSYQMESSERSTRFCLFQPSTAY